MDLWEWKMWEFVGRVELVLVEGEEWGLGEILVEVTPKRELQLVIGQGGLNEWKDW